MQHARPRDAEERHEIPVRGHRFRDWIARVRGRGPVGLPVRPRTRRVAEDDEVRIEVVLPGFRAGDIEVYTESDRVFLRARRSEADARRSEHHLADLTLPIGPAWDGGRGRADLQGDELVVRFPKRESALPRRIPIRRAAH